MFFLFLGDTPATEQDFGVLGPVPAGSWIEGVEFLSGLTSGSSNHKVGCGVVLAERRLPATAAAFAGYGALAQGVVDTATGLTGGRFFTNSTNGGRVFVPVCCPVGVATWVGVWISNLGASGIQVTAGVRFRPLVGGEFGTRSTFGVGV